MSSPATFLTQDHRECDEVWAELEAVASEGRREAATSLFGEFETVMRRHFDFEEQHLFPAFEQATGMQGFGPTAVMRHEHAHMRRVLEEMQDAVRHGDLEALLAQGDTLLMLVQQHNVKEEQILYPACDARLGAQWPAMREAWPSR